VFAIYIYADEFYMISNILGVY